MALLKELFLVFVLLGATYAAPTFMKELEKDEKAERMSEKLDAVMERLNVLKSAAKSLKREFSGVPKFAVEDAPKEDAKKSEAVGEPMFVVEKAPKEKKSVEEIIKEDEEDDIEKELQTALHSKKDSLKSIAKSMKKDTPKKLMKDSKKHKPANTGSGMRHDSIDSNDEKLVNDVEKLRNGLSKLKDTIERVKSNLEEETEDEAPKKKEAPKSTFITHYDQPEDEKLDDEAFEDDDEDLMEAEYQDAFGHQDEPKEHKPAFTRSGMRHDDEAFEDDDEDRMEAEYQDAFGHQDEPEPKDAELLAQEAAEKEQDRLADEQDKQDRVEDDAGILETGAAARKQLLDELKSSSANEPKGPDSDSAEKGADGPDFSESDNEYIGGPPGTEEDANEDEEKEAEKEQDRLADEQDKQDRLEDEAAEAELRAMEEAELQDKMDAAADAEMMRDEEAEEEVPPPPPVEEQVEDEQFGPVEDEEVPPPEILEDEQFGPDDKTFIENAPDADVGKEHTENVEEPNLQDELAKLQGELKGYRAEFEALKREQAYKKKHQ